ncbi:MAG: hypothetical protein AABX07_05040 [Nanoarchaeota archaeon]
MENKTTIREICGEAYNIVREPFNCENARLVGRSSLCFASSYGRQLIAFTLAPYRIPTAIRKTRNFMCSDFPMNRTVLEDSGAVLGWFAGAGSGIATNYILMSLPGSADERIIGTFLFSNLASGVYEFLRYARNKVIERKSLESKAK